MKKRTALLTSILTIALCLVIISGSTFALFTDKTEFNITVKAAQVKLDAEIGDVLVYSAKPDANADPADKNTLVDEYNKTYVHEKQDDMYFANGGLVTVDKSTGLISIQLITPGDRVVIPISAVNDSNVAIMYRYTIMCKDDASYAIMQGNAPLTFTMDHIPYTIGGKGFVSSWETLLPGQNMESTNITIDLPVNAGNEYQNMSAEFYILVEAFQANAAVDGPVETDDNTIIENGVIPGKT